MHRLKNHGDDNLFEDLKEISWFWSDRHFFLIYFPNMNCKAMRNIVRPRSGCSYISGQPRACGWSRYRMVLKYRCPNKCLFLNAAHISILCLKGVIDRWFLFAEDELFIGGCWLSPRAWLPLRLSLTNLQALFPVGFEHSRFAENHLPNKKSN